MMQAVYDLLQSIGILIIAMTQIRIAKMLKGRR